ncbi:MAG: rod shape-determining protein RodA [Ignavibacterium sp.]|nr:rod shape-determining protein RodA [Melioribacteraceae bacterium]MDD3559278.1 rod shape-determining protein RodA [Melioribacteraceae bacterium]MDD5609697.1 rod shape-determining protein RodA [Ignavibacterium sp.]
MQVGYKLQDKFDFYIFIPVIILISIGLIAVYSATINHPTAQGNFEKQLFWSIFSLLAFVVVYYLPSQTMRISAWPVYGITIITLIAVLIIGKTVYGAKSWINFGPVGFQPAEFAKIGTILALAVWLGTKKHNINNVKDIGVALLLGIFPVMLILMEPDLGTSIVFVFFTLVIIYWSGISLFGLFVVLSPAIVVFSSIFGTISLILTLIGTIILLFLFKRDLFISATVFVLNVAAGFVFDYVFSILQPHQQKRIETFLDPASDPLGSGYNSLQAKVAIGSGGFWGKGFLEGNQTQLRFIPEQWTDFIYCVVGEEFGFLGSLFVILLFTILFLRMLHLAFQIRNQFRSLIIIGVLTLFFVHFAINIGMNVGIMPIIGLPLPFISYGGSSLTVNMILLGIVMNIYRNRKMHI